MKLEVARTLLLALGCTSGLLLIAPCDPSGAIVLVWTFAFTACLCALQARHAQTLLRDGRLRTRALRPLLASVAAATFLVGLLFYVPEFAARALLVLIFLSDTVAEYVSAVRMLEVMEWLSPSPPSEPSEHSVRVLAWTIPWLAFRGGLVSLPFAPYSSPALAALVVAVFAAYCTVVRVRLALRIQRALSGLRVAEGMGELMPRASA